MKKVVLSSTCNEVNINNIKNTDIVGIKWVEGNKSLVIPCLDIEMELIFIGHEFEDNDLGDCWDAASKNEYAKEAMSMDAEVFVFESLVGFAKWFEE